VPSKHFYNIDLVLKNHRSKILQNTPPINTISFVLFLLNVSLNASSPFFCPRFFFTHIVSFNFYFHIWSWEECYRSKYSTHLFVWYIIQHIFYKVNFFTNWYKRLIFIASNIIVWLRGEINIFYVFFFHHGFVLLSFSSLRFFPTRFIIRNVLMKHIIDEHLTYSVMNFSISWCPSINFL